jgi:hypothetical protein
MSAEEVNVDGIGFHINVMKKMVTFKIDFVVKDHSFTEKVKALTLKDFEN